MTTLRPAITEALKKCGRRITAAELYDLLGTAEPKKRVNGTLFRMKGDGSVTAFAGDSPHKTLYAIGGTAGKAAAAAPAPKKVHRNGHHHARPARPDAEQPPRPGASPAAACNVAAFTPAMTSDRRMVLVGGTEPLIFSSEQTQAIADLVLAHFEAGA